MAANVEYFYSEDTQRTYAVVMGKGILVLDGQKWTIHPTGGQHWDALHQKIYRDRRWIERLSSLARLQLPRLPDLSDIQPIDPSVEAGAGISVPASDLPHLATAVPEGTTAALSVVLFEDLWETQYGDGAFHYPRFALLDPGAVKRHAIPREGVKWHHRTMTVAHRNGRLSIPDFTLQLFDQCTLVALLTLANKQLETPPD
ncbi:MAG: hypothetical protein ACI8RZ_000361 [Myxococcota bacterium]